MPIRLGYRADVQGLRAVAVLMVVGYHARLPVPGGFTGVDVFFALSGFVIARMLLRERLAGHKISIPQFFARRFKRLTPALSVMVTVVLVVAVVLASPFGDQQTLALTAIGATFIMANLVIAQASGGYFDAPAESNALLNTWSLSVEEQFYLFFPLMLMVAWRLESRGLKWRRGGVVVVASVLSISAVSVVLLPGGGNEVFGFYSPIARAWEFAAGALLALCLPQLALRSRLLAGSFGVVGIALILVSSFVITKSATFPGPATVFPVAGTLLLLIAGTHPSNLVTRTLSVRPLQIVGDYSYSIYLWHWPVIVLATTFINDSRPVILFALLTSVVPAVASYRLVERPLRRAEWSGTGVWSRAIGLCVGTPVVVAALLHMGASQRWWINWDSAPAYDDFAAAEHCVDAPLDLVRCVWKVDGSRGEVLLVGDSQALVLADGVIAASHALGFDVVVSARSGCPFLTIDTSGTKPIDCPSWQRQVFDYIESRSPQVVIVANRSLGYTNPELGWRTFVDSNGRPVSRGDALILYAKSLTEVARRLEASDSGLLLVQNIPELKVLRSRNSIGRMILLDRQPPRFDASETLALRTPIANLERSIAGKLKRVDLVDPADVLCSETMCDRYRGDESLYLDSFHLSRFGSLELTNLLGARLEQLISGAEQP